MAAPTAKPLMSWKDLLSRPRPRADATIAYGADPYQRIDVWLPKGAGPFPVVVMVHGGCWASAIADRTIMDWAAADLRASGVAVWNIDYRGVDRPGGGYPGTFADTAKAADQLLGDAAKYYLDLTRLVAVGHSAGGHLALWLAGRARLPAASPLHRPHPLPVRHDVYADTSIPRLLPLGARQNLVDGRNDEIIPERLATGYVAKARAAGDPVGLHLVADTGHVELIAPGTPAWAEAKRLILDALRR